MTSQYPDLNHPSPVRRKLKTDYIMVAHWIVQIILSYSFLRFIFQYNTPPKSSAGLLRHFDGAFERWASRLTAEGFLDGDHWLLGCPALLSDCCPRVSTLESDRMTVTQLYNMSPAAKFAYVVLRRACEAVTQGIASWLLPASLLAFVLVLVMANFGDPKQFGRKNLRVRRYLFFTSLMLASVVVPIVLEMGIGGIVQYELKKLAELTKPSTSMSVIQIHAALVKSRTPSFLDFLLIPGLWRSFYSADYEWTPVPGELKELAFLQTRLALMGWSLFGLLLVELASVGFLLEKLVVNPLLKFTEYLLTDSVDVKPCKKEKPEGNKWPNVTSNERCDKKILRPGDKRTASTFSFTTYLGIDDDQSPSNKFIEQLDSLTYPEPGPMLLKDNSTQDKSDKRTQPEMPNSSSESRPRSRYSVRPITQQLCGFPRSSSTPGPARSIADKHHAAFPRRLSKGTYVCFESSDSDEGM